MAPSSSIGRRRLLELGGLTALGAGLSACSGKSLGDTGSGGSGDAKQLQFMFWGSTAEQKAIAGMLKDFEKEKSGVTVKPVFTPADYDTKLNALVASNRQPDLCYMQSPMGYRLAEQGKLVNLFPYFDKYPDLANRLPGTYFWWDKGKTYGTQSANEIMALWYSKPALKDAGIETPPAEADKAWSWDTFVQNAYKLTVDQNGKHPDQDGFDPKRIRQYGVSAAMSPIVWHPLLLSRGIDFADETGRKSMLDTPEAIEVFQNLADLMYKHRVAPTPAQLGNNAPSTTVQLKTRRVAMVIDGQWTLLDLAQGKLEFGMGVLPKYAKPMTITLGGATAIFSSTKHVEEAVELYLFHDNPTKVDLFSTGLWMPLEKRYYTDPKDIDVWTKNDAHPPEYKTAAIDYTVNNSAPYFYQKLRNIEAIDKVLTPAIQVIQQGKTPAAEVLKPLAAKLNGGLLKGTYPTDGN
ncbi:sugar ABC transporter substrate-binding protein [Kribbella sp. VKM Ac-2566]|uniref:ABC transporter substrate-binding protein n=1 Tax=Kribbella sp. VKM Ac-2566 TaxID=2512218 RepID=UPI0010640A9B|nr:sugar ABC transporter substrate-binding protein [Kribbella sp. VKM Ac-2566]TDX03563.1 carbohydrate ABC transporter substrate-binding protein (CUT1 family) [Kribbella sp. VKM Ac-2566]